MKYKPSAALKEHMLLGHKVTPLEAILLFGVANPYQEMKNLRKDFLVKTEKVNMAKVIRRLNEYTMCKVPENLPHTEIIMTEYWVSL